MYSKDFEEEADNDLPPDVYSQVTMYLDGRIEIKGDAEDLGTAAHVFGHMRDVLDHHIAELGRRLAERN